MLYSDASISRVIIELYTRSINDYPLDRADIHNIAAHEFGHALGLGHTKSPFDLMFQAYDFLMVNRVILPSNCDLDRLLSLYMDDGFAPPNSSSKTSDFSCPGAAHRKPSDQLHGRRRG